MNMLIEIHPLEKQIARKGEPATQELWYEMIVQLSKSVDFH